MSTHNAIFNLDDLKNFLIQKGDSISKTTYEELMFGLFVTKFHAKLNEGEFLLGIPVKRGVETDNDVSTIEQITSVINDWEDKNSPYDFTVIKGDVDFSKKENRVGIPYQLKRFQTLSNTTDITEQLLNYIQNVIPNKYGLVGGILLLYIGADLSRLNIETVVSGFRPHSYPFEMVSFIAREGSNLVFCQLWPGCIRYEIDPLDLLAD